MINRKKLMKEICEIISQNTGLNLDSSDISEDFHLAGNILDSMAVTNLIMALEEYYGFTFEDEELTAETFETVNSLTDILEKKMKMQYE